MKELRLETPAKINWRLAITGRREDGYHMLTGLMQSISLSDSLLLRPAAVDSCRMEPPLPHAGDVNLALKAWRLLKEELKLRQGLEIFIEKRIPLGGGLGGGSSDAAAVLNGANRLFDLRLSQAELAALALRLGADVPFCLNGGLAKAQGVGEKLTPLPDPPPLKLLLVNPGITLPTERVFATYKTSGQSFVSEAGEEQACAALAVALSRGDTHAINSLLANDLAESARRLCPDIGVLEQRLRDIGLCPLLSGSGGTVFALIQEDVAVGDVPWQCVAVTTARSTRRE